MYHKKHNDLFFKNIVTKLQIPNIRNNDNINAKTNSLRAVSPKTLFKALPSNRDKSIHDFTKRTKKAEKSKMKIIEAFNNNGNISTTAIIPFNR